MARRNSLKSIVPSLLASKVAKAYLEKRKNDFFSSRNLFFAQTCKTIRLFPTDKIVCKLRRTFSCWVFRSDSRAEIPEGKREISANVSGFLSLSLSRCATRGFLQGERKTNFIEFSFGSNFLVYLFPWISCSLWANRFLKIRQIEKLENFSSLRLRTFLG